MFNDDPQAHHRAAMPTPRLARTTGLIALVGLLLALCASPAGAASIYACVKRHSGSVRLVGPKTKCKTTERRVTWSTTGPTGPSGLPGTPGTAGANGVGPDYASRVTALTLLGEGESGTVVVSRTIPAGSYLVSGKAVIGGNGKNPVFVVAICELLDTVGTPTLVELNAALDAGQWAQEYDLNGAVYTGATSMDLQAQLTTTQPTTLALVCIAPDGPKTATVAAITAQVNALRTTTNS